MWLKIYVLKWVCRTQRLQRNILFLSSPTKVFPFTASFGMYIRHESVRRWGCGEWSIYMNRAFVRMVRVVGLYDAVSRDTLHVLFQGKTYSHLTRKIISLMWLQQQNRWIQTLPSASDESSGFSLWNLRMNCAWLCTITRYTRYCGIEQAVHAWVSQGENTTNFVVLNKFIA